VGDENVFRSGANRSVLALGGSKRTGRGKDFDDIFQSTTNRKKPKKKFSARGLPKSIICRAMALDLSKKRKKRRNERKTADAFVREKWRGI